MWILFGRRKLRLEECRHVEAMSWRFDGADFALWAAGRHGKARFHGGPFEVGIEFEVTEEFFSDRLFIFSVEGLQIRPRAQSNLRHRAGKFRSVALAVWNRAGYGIDDDVLRSGIVFGAVSVGDFQNIACEFDECILESGTGAEVGPIAAACEFDAFEHAIEALKGAAG